MGVLGDFLSPEAGQKRTKWRNEKADDLYEGLQYYLGPTGIPDKLKAVAELLQFTDAGDVYEAQAGAEDMRNAETVWDAIGGAGRMATGITAAALPVVGAKMANNLTDAGIDWLGSAVDDLMAGYDPTRVNMGLRLFHGSDSRFDEFDLSAPVSGGRSLGRAMYLTPDPQDAAGYGRYVYEYDVDGVSPLVARTSNYNFNVSDDYSDYLRQQGYDSLITRLIDKDDAGNIASEYDYEMALYDPTKARLAKVYDTFYQSYVDELAGIEPTRVLPFDTAPTATSAIEAVGGASIANPPFVRNSSDISGVDNAGISVAAAADDPATTRGQEILDLLSTNPSAVTDDMLDMGDPVLNARLNEYLWNNYDLPMDEASRMARAEGMGDFYHSTRADFTEFDKGDVGYHVGTDEQAQQRLINTRRERGVEGESILPLRARIENSLQSADAGEWDDARFAGRTLRDAGLPVDDIIDEAEELAPQFEDNDYWKWSPENEGLLGDLGYSLNDAGYDSVKYANEAENAYGDIPGLTRQGKALSNALRKERSELRAAIVGRRPPPPDDPAEIESWLAMPQPRPTADEARRLAEIDAELDRIDTVMVNDGASYILMDPTNIRSRFARFDPRLAHLRNLNAGLAGLGLGAVLGLQQPSDERELREYLGGI